MVDATIAKDAKNILERAKTIFAVLAGFAFFYPDRATKTFVLTLRRLS